MRRSSFTGVSLFLKGVSMGAAHVVPGVSGGTMALITGIYEDLIEALRSFDTRFLSLLTRGRFRQALRHVSFRFLAILGAGIIAAFLSLAKLITWLLERHPVPTWGLFFGLIVASALIVARRIRGWSPTAGVCLVSAAVAAYLLMGVVPVNTPEELWFVFLSGCASITAMILPGVSGAHVLLILGKYRYTIDAVLRLDLPVLASFAAGCAFGVIAFSHVLHWLLSSHRAPTMAALTGFMVGSLRRIWPWKETVETVSGRHGEPLPVVQTNILPEAGMESLLALLAAVAGGALVLLIERSARRR